MTPSLHFQRVCPKGMCLDGHFSLQEKSTHIYIVRLKHGSDLLHFSAFTSAAVSQWLDAVQQSRSCAHPPVEEADRKLLVESSGLRLFARHCTSGRQLLKH